MKIGIIGCGYIGQAAAALWRNSRHTVFGTTTRSENLTNLSTLVDHAIYLNDPQNQLNSLVSEIDALLICVAPHSHSIEAYEATYLNTAKLIYQALEHTSKKLQIIYTSSTSVYGDSEGAWVTEENNKPSLSPYASILHETEKTLEACRTKGHLVCIFRLGEITGPGREIQKRLKNLAGKELPGTGDNFTNIIHQKDIVEALNFALKHQLDGTFNLCNDLHIRRKELYLYLAEKYHFPLPKWNPQVSSIHGGNKKVSNEKLKNLGFQFLYPLYID